MVAGLVEQENVWSGQQHFGEHEPALLASAEGLHGPIILRRSKAQTIQNSLDPMIDIVSVVMTKQVIEPLVASGQDAAFTIVGGCGQSFGRADHVLVSGQ